MNFDAIIVGAGMGGGAVALSLSKAGYKVLLIERGSAKKNWNSEYASNYSEYFLNSKSERSKIYSQSGRATYQVNNWIPVLGSGEGGSSAVYGAVFMRFFPHDFTSWPYSYNSLSSYYKKCEELFQPIGEQDPLFPEDRSLKKPKSISDCGKEIFDFFSSKGLHPFQTSIAYEDVDDCQKCFGHFCIKNCKKTSSNVFLEPSLRTGNLEILYSTCVEKLIVEKNQIKGVYCQSTNGPQQFYGKTVFLSAGALATPSILLNTKTEMYPHGVGNNYDQVGRYLMRHLIDFYFVKTPKSAFASGHLNEICVSDFYHNQENKLGFLSFVPSLMTPKLMAQEFVERVKIQNKLPIPKALFKFMFEKFLIQITSGKVLITSILDDSPQFKNRVYPLDSIDNLKVEYQLDQNDKIRLKKSRKTFKNLLAPLSVSLVKVGEDNSFLAHACGTCRMNINPKNGVVDIDGKVHNINNLYITDASIFPTSGGANPALTVAATSMKIAEEFKIKSHR